jgi:hypothetical protein
LIDDRLPYFGMSGGKVLRDVSGPGSRLSGSSQDGRKFCVARHPGECVAGSRAGEVFANLPNLKWNNCRITQSMIPDGPDVCVANLAPYGQAVTQFGLSKPPSDRPGAHNRVLTRYLGAYRRGTIFANAKALPDGSWALFPGSFDPLEILAVKIPPVPQPDGIDRSKYVPVSVRVPPHPAAGKARLAYGYEENGGRGDFFCTQRPEPCTLPATPGGSVEIPAVPQRVLFHEVQYLDAQGAVIGKSGLAAAAVP